MYLVEVQKPAFSRDGWPSPDVRVVLCPPDAGLHGSRKIGEALAEQLGPGARLRSVSRPRIDAAEWRRIGLSLGLHLD